MDNRAYNDQPISRPSEDRFGIEPFAKALAASIERMAAPHGSVLAINGPWGSGKSSAVNLVRYHLSGAVRQKAVVLIDFACWWFRGEEALTLAFFRELYSGLSPSLSAKVRDSIPKLGAQLLHAGSTVGAAADALGAAGFGKAAGSAMDWAGTMIAENETVEKLHKKLAKALAKQEKRFVIFIDDIDRLSPEEALLIFRLVKSVGQLPNVMYVMIYDRELADRIVSERFPSEGPHYLEKIVQAAFDLPEPSTTDMQQHLSDTIASICGTAENSVRMMNIFYEWLAPAMRTPRDVARFSNMLSVTWPVVSGEVDQADFLALEGLRLFQPSVYRAVRHNKSLLCGSGEGDTRNRDSRTQRFNQALFGQPQQIEDPNIRRVLTRLFPAIESAWSNVSYADGYLDEWAQQRRVCSQSHFDAYFRFMVGDEVLMRSALDEFILRANEQAYVIATLREAATLTRRSGGTRAAVVLEELRTHAGRIQQDAILTLLSSLFQIADELDVEADKGQAFNPFGNQLRLHWLVRALTMDRMSLADRSALLLEASSQAQVDWLAHFSHSAWDDHHPREGRQPELPDHCLTTEIDAHALRDLTRIKITQAAHDGTLLNHPNLARLLYEWDDISEAGNDALREWLELAQGSEEGLRHLASAFTSYGWTQSLGFSGLGDSVAKRTTNAQIDGLERLLDVEVFRTRLEAIVDSQSTPEVAEFLAAWRRREAGGNRARRQ